MIFTRGLTCDQQHEWARDAAQEAVAGHEHCHSARQIFDETYDEAIRYLVAVSHWEFDTDTYQTRAVLKPVVSHGQRGNA